MHIQQMYHYCKANLEKQINNERGQFAIDIALGLAVVLIISAFVILPKLTDLGTTFMTDITTWWTGTMKAKLFKSSAS